MTLAEALAQVPLEPGRTYECQVQGNRIVVQVVPGRITQPVARYDESDVMLDPWCDLPIQGERITDFNLVQQRLPINIPYIPRDDE